MDSSSVVKQPTYAGSCFAVVAAACVTGMLATQPIQVSIAGIEVVGALLVLGSGLVRRRGYSILGGSLVLVGCILIFLTLGLSILVPIEPFKRITFFSGVFATACIVLGVFPLRQSWERFLVVLGVALFTCALTVQTWVSSPGTPQILFGAVLTIVTWDLAEHAITLGEDVGRSTQTYPVTGIHLAGSLGVGLAAGTVALAVATVQLPAVPSTVFALLLGAILLLLLVIFLGGDEWSPEA